MKQIATFFVAIIIPLQLFAETVVLRSGEHADFSRIVVQFEGSRNWEFGKVSGGYELRTDAISAEFDLDRVFDLIPRRRIKAISLPGPGRIHFAVSCACQGDIFEIRQGRLVIDIKDGVSDGRSQFNSLLPDLVATEAGNPENPTTEEPQLSITSLGSVAFVTQTDLSLLQSENYQQQDETIAALKLLMSELGVAVPRPDEIKSAEPLQPVPNPSMLGNGSETKPHEYSQQGVEIDSSLLLPDDPWPLLPIFPSMPAPRLEQHLVTPSARLANAESALLRQLSRAAAQGLVNVESPQISGNFSGAEKVESTSSQNLLELDSVADPLEITVELGDHLRLETAVDRGVVPEKQSEQLNSQGHICLRSSLFDVGEWGPQSMSQWPFDGLRNGIVQEFDTPNPAAIEMLAKRYLFLGFGAELKQLLRSFDTDIPDRDIYLQMAEVLDNGTSSIFGRLDRQISCSTPGAMWAVLSKDKIPAGADLDTKAVLRAFSGVPPHLRRHLGPVLVERFLDNGDIETAHALRKITDRAVDNRDEGFDLMSARISSFSGDITATLQHLQAIVTAGSSQLPQAVAEIIEIRVDANLGVDENLVLHADALAAEYRGTDVGRRLTKAAIRGFAEAGEAALTFGRIEEAFENGSITLEESAKLNADAHLKSAQISSDSEFLTVVYQYPLVNGIELEAEAAARRFIAARLVQLGLPRKAQQLYALPELELIEADRKILAAASLGMGNAANAISLLADIEGREALQLLALAREQQQEFSAAATIYTSLAMEPEMESSLWRAQDLQGLAMLPEGPKSKFAELTLTSDVSAIPSARDMQGTDAINPPELLQQMDANAAREQPIAHSKQLLVNSTTTRGILDGLLGG